jgi:hypothetical protein
MARRLLIDGPLGITLRLREHSCPPSTPASWTQPMSNDWLLVRSYKNSVPLPDLGTTLKGHACFRPPVGLTESML